MDFQCKRQRYDSRIGKQAPPLGAEKEGVSKGIPFTHPHPRTWSLFIEAPGKKR
ncbi:BgTH12-05151 [Blumeria graminis f. sp. triticale]|uniref:BgTH12-05151 n=1 Tax=Blumeria graminis f. sp. triticale TaxID=1689686 RepID=A0A9W4D741_BLUGR|nr:BgTH12-05151 [Blumeria graminis f. sp. triticale]